MRRPDAGRGLPGIRTGGMRAMATLAVMVLLFAACAGTQPKDLSVPLIQEPTAGEGSLDVDPESGEAGRQDVGTGLGDGGDGSGEQSGRAGGESTLGSRTGGRNDDSATGSDGQNQGTGGQTSGDDGNGAERPDDGGQPDDETGGATDVGVTEDTIKLGGFYIESGPVGDLGITLLKAALAVFKEVNAEGGIHGRRIQVIDCDTSFTSGEKPRACYSKLTEEDNIFMFAAMGDGPANVTGVPLMCDDGIPGIWLDGLVAVEFACPIVYPTGPAATNQSHVLADYYVQQRNPETVGILYQNDKLGAEWRDAGKEIFQKNGVEVVAEESYNLGQQDFSQEVTAMRFADPDFIFFASEPLGPILFQIQAESQGYKPPLPGAGVTCNVSVWPQQVGDYTVGMLCQHPWLPVSERTAEQEEFIATYDKYWGKDDLDKNGNYYTEVHWVAAKATVETLRRAGKDLTRDRVLEVLNGGAFDGYDTGFGVQFEQRRSPLGGNQFTTQVAILEITDPTAPGYGEQYTLRRGPVEDPFFGD